MSMQRSAITQSVARDIARAQMIPKGSSYALHPSAVREEDFGWVFFWGPREYVIDQPQEGVEFTGPGVGGGEIAILRRDGSVRECRDPVDAASTQSIAALYRGFHPRVHQEWLRCDPWQAYAERGDEELALERYFLDAPDGGIPLDRFEDDMSPYFDVAALVERHSQRVWELAIIGSRVVRRPNPSIS